MSKVIIFPTDTVYGIGTPIFDLEGIKRIYKIKNRPLDKPLACLCSDLEQIKSICVVSSDAIKLINKFLPGALTLILESRPEVYEKIGYKTIGVRIPNYSKALDILKENGPMLTTSVNESGNVPLNEYEEIYKNYNDLVDYIYDSDKSSSNHPSTVLSLIEGVKVLREGDISLKDINNCLKN